MTFATQEKGLTESSIHQAGMISLPVAESTSRFGRGFESTPPVPVKTA
jgi:hypothetical protein